MTPVLLLCAALAAESVVAVGLDGTAEAPERSRIHAQLVDALRGVDGLEVVALADPAAMLGAAVQQRLAACADDRCRIAALGAVVRGPVVFGAVDRLGPGQVRLDLRVATATAGTTVRISRDVKGSVDATLIEIAGALFPGRAVRPTAKLTVEVDVAGAAISVDGVPVGVAPLGALDVPLGKRVIAATLPDGRRADATAELTLGGAVTVELSLGARRTALPFIVAGGALALAGGGVALGLAAEGTASPWQDACPNGVCGPGFSRARYDADADVLATERTVANVLFVGASAALVSAVVLWIVEGSP